MFKERKNLKIVTALFCALFIFGICGCATMYNPATGQQEFIFIDTQDEIQIGKKAAQQVQREYKIYREPKMNEHINKIGQRVARVNDRQDLPYYFIILDDDDINAFTIPGGYVYVFRGLVDFADTDDELAGVLAHEVGHIAARHIVKKMQAQMGAGFFLTILMNAVGEEYQQVVNDLAGTVFNLAMLGYSREDEYFADILAVRYMKRAGYNPEAMISFLEKLKKIDKDRPPAFFSTHPGLEERIVHIKQEINRPVSQSTSPQIGGQNRQEPKK